jgi:hypothetical protein
MNKEPTKDIQEESAKLPAGSSLEFNQSEMIGQCLETVAASKSSVLRVC